MAGFVKIKGLKECGEALRQFPEKIQKNVMRGALRAGAKVIRDAIKARAPVGEPGSGDPGQLRDSVRLKSTRVVQGMVEAGVSVGLNPKAMNKRGSEAFYVHFLEFGTAAHTINARGPGRGGKLAMKVEGGFYKTVHHPGIAPHPFVRPGFEESAPLAVYAVADYIRSVLKEKHGIEVPYPGDPTDDDN